MYYRSTLFFILMILVFFSCPSPKASVEDHPIHFNCITSEITSGAGAALIDSIADFDVLMGNAVSVAGAKPEQFKRYERLLELLTASALEMLCHHHSPVVRGYAFQGMMQTAHPGTFEILKELLRDTTSTNTMYGCTFDKVPIKLQALNFFATEPAVKGHYQPTPNERVYVDSLWLFSPALKPHLPRHNFANTFPVERHYSALKAMPSDIDRGDVLAGLANFKKEADLPLFLESFGRRKFYDTAAFDLELPMEIVLRYPHPRFVPELRLLQDKLLNPECTNMEVEAMYFYLAVFSYSPSIISSFVEELGQATDSYSKATLQSGLWLAAQLNTNPRKRRFAPDIEPGEWLGFILDHSRELEKFSRLD